MDEHTDEFKKEIFFNNGDIIVDPFCGSGTTLVQANELAINAIGIDVSFFNSFISNCKIDKYNLDDISKEINLITLALKRFLLNKNTLEFEEELLKELYIFNNKYFPRSEFKRNVHSWTPSRQCGRQRPRVRGERPQSDWAFSSPQYDPSILEPRARPGASAADWTVGTPLPRNRSPSSLGGGVYRRPSGVRGPALSQSSARLLWRCRSLTRTGVPSKPKLSRRRFSRKRT